jgi:hypothetical protein
MTRTPKATVCLINRNGLFYVRLQPSPWIEPIEIVLHGVVSVEQANLAAEALITRLEDVPVAKQFPSEEEPIAQ